MFEIDLDYITFKEKINSKNLLWQYVEDVKKYDIFAFENFIKYNTTVWKDLTNTIGFDNEQEILNKIDFETNYKTQANQKLIADVNEEPISRPTSISGIDELGLKQHIRTDSSGFIIPTNRGIVSTSNSTATPLDSGATYVGTSEEVKDFATITVFLYSDQPSALNGLVIEWSSDEINWDANDTFSYDPSNEANRLFSFGSVSKYFRIRYTNGTETQTEFRLQTILHPFQIKSSSHRIGDTLSLEADAELVKSILSAQNDEDRFANIGSVTLFNSHRLKTSVSDIRLEFAIRNKLYIISADQNLAVGNSENNVFLIRNPIGNTKKMYISDSIFDVVTKDRLCIWRIYKNPTVTNVGTSVVISSSRVGGSPPASTMEIYSDPITSNFGTRIRSFSTGTNSNSTDVNFGLGFILEPGNDLLVVGIPNGNNVIVSLSLQWVED